MSKRGIQYASSLIPKKVKCMRSDDSKKAAKEDHSNKLKILLENEYDVNQVMDGNIVLGLIYELFDADSGFRHNASMLIDAYKKNMLFGVSLRQTDDLLDKDVNNDVFMPIDIGIWQLPAFCIMGEARVGIGYEPTIEIIWVHPRIQRHGVGTAMVNAMSVTHVFNTLPDSHQFWDSMVDITHYPIQ